MTKLLHCRLHFLFSSHYKCCYSTTAHRFAHQRHSQVHGHKHWDGICIFPTEFDTWKIQTQERMRMSSRGSTQHRSTGAQDKCSMDSGGGY